MTGTLAASRMGLVAAGMITYVGHSGFSFISIGGNVPPRQNTGSYVHVLPRTPANRFEIALERFFRMTLLLADP